jgi:hypothetical protein
MAARIVVCLCNRRASSVAHLIWGGGLVNGVDFTRSVFENRIIRGIFLLESKGVRVGWRKTHIDELNSYCA